MHCPTPVDLSRMPGRPNTVTGCGCGHCLILWGGPMDGHEARMPREFPPSFTIRYPLPGRATWDSVYLRTDRRDRRLRLIYKHQA